MKKIILTRGIPASGKSTWTKQEVLKDPEHSVRINRDDLRNMSGKYWVPARENYIIACRNQLLNLAICIGFDTIILDDMNLNPKDFEYVSIVVVLLIVILTVISTLIFFGSEFNSLSLLSSLCINVGVLLIFLSNYILFDIY